MKKLMGILSVACLCGWLVGCGAEDATSVDAPVTPPTTSGESMTADPSLTTEDPAMSGEVTTPEDSATPEETTTPDESTDDPAAP